MDSIPKRTYRAVVDVRHGDCREVIKTLADNSIDSAVTDPPYSLVSIQKRFGKPGSAPAKEGKDGLYRRASAGFMGQQWDTGEVAHDPEFWAEVYRVLKPGGFLVAFGGTRTYHRLASAIEDSGFVIQDCLMWLFATGFPKRRDMLKPAYEPIVLAYKPGGKRTLQVDECRIGMSPDDAAKIANMGGFGKASYQRQPGNSLHLSIDPMPCQDAVPHTLGRWPANICHDGSDEVVALFPVSGGQQGDVTGAEPSSKMNNVYGQFDGRPATTGRNDSGSAARFFFSAKAGKEDRFGSRHPTVKPVELIRWLIRLVTPPGGTIIDPFAGSGTAGVAALAEGVGAILIEREDAYVADIRERMAFYEGGGRHSTAAKARSAIPRGAMPLFDDQP